MTATLPVREHLRPKPGLRCSNPRFDIALEWIRLPGDERDPHGWRWEPQIGCPSTDVEALPTWGQA